MRYEYIQNENARFMEFIVIKVIRYTVPRGGTYPYEKSQRPFSSACLFEWCEVIIHYHRCGRRSVMNIFKWP